MKILKYSDKFLVVFFFFVWFGLRNEMKSIGKLVNSNVFVCFPRIELLMITKCCLSKPPTTGVSVSFQHKFQFDFPRIEIENSFNIQKKWAVKSFKLYLIWRCIASPLKAHVCFSRTARRQFFPTISCQYYESSSVSLQQIWYSLPICTCF